MDRDAGEDRGGTPPDRMSVLAAHVAWQTKVFRSLGSPIYAALGAALAGDLNQGGPIARALAAHEGDPARDLPFLRVLGGLHRLALRGAAPDLARHLPSCGGAPDFATLWADAQAVAAREPEALREALATTPQTNEVQRSAVLVPGFHRIAARTDLPMDLREIGASAGLNQFFDRFRIDYGAFALGPEPADLRLACDWRGPPVAPRPIVVASRAGCDLRPIDLADDHGRLRLESYVWPDQAARLARLRQAIAIARSDPPRLEAQEAGRFVAAQLAARRPGRVLVLFHSFVWSYLGPEEQGAITRAVTRAGAEADAERPLAWLTLEDVPDHSRHELTLTYWPGGERRVLARASPHGQWLHWLDVAE